jgi:hypothetical protein
MKKIILPFCILFLLSTAAFAQEMEVDGALRVTGGINAEGQAITNVGDPQNPSDAATMSSVETIVNNMPGLGGSQPERIYSLILSAGQDFELIVPDDKIWQVKLLVTTNSNSYISINSISMGLTQTPTYGVTASTIEFWLTSGDIIQNYGHQPYNREKVFSIFEYPISSSGTSQGMNYIEP